MESSLKSLSLSTSSSPGRPSSLAVTFCAVEIREYARTVGDNPTAIGGPPLGLDWNYEDSTPIPIDDFEERRRQASLEEGHTPFLPVPGKTREKILLEHTSCTRKDIAVTLKELRKARDERQIGRAHV